MPSSMPDAPTLLTAAIKYLEGELLPTLTGYHRFKCRVTANVLSTIRRELELHEKYSERERERLRALLGHDGDVQSLSTELAESIREGKLAVGDRALQEHLRESLIAALAINNPRWLRS
jgi:hypothetical protein